jgi:predicted HAD superfamily Cof-like phosphohydrolase
MTKGTNDLYRMVTEFHNHFNIEKQKAHPMMHAAKIKHLNEELCEYMKAVYNQDREGQLDALVDLVYVALGAAYMDNFNFNGAFHRVHEANMLKMRKSTDRSQWDVVKPDGWQAPDLKQFIDQQ